jgi:hypothetical protein
MAAASLFFIQVSAGTADVNKPNNHET